MQVTPGDASGTSGHGVGVNYFGPPLALWAAAWMYAEALTDGDPEATDDTRAILARAITIEADYCHLLPTDRSALVPSPAVLASVTLGRLAVDRLNEIKSVVEFGKRALGVVPAPTDPGYTTYRSLYDLVTQDGASTAEVVANPELLNQVKQAASEWEQQRVLAFKVIYSAVVETATSMADTPDLAQLNRRLNDFLARHQ